MDSSDTRTKIPSFRRLSDLHQAIRIPLPSIQDSDFTIYRLEELCPTVTSKTPPFRTEYYSVFLIESGRGSYYLDDQEFKTKPSTLYLNNPGHVKCFEVRELYRGLIITFSEQYLKEFADSDALGLFPFLLEEAPAPYHLKRKHFSTLVDMLLPIEIEYKSRSNYKHQIIGSLLTAFLFKTKEIVFDTYQERMKNSEVVATFQRNLEKKFRELLKGQIKRMPKAAQFAQMQFLSADYFNTLIKRKTGRTVSHFIRDKTLTEARRLLRRSDVAVGEIADKLGFVDAAHFNKFFKKNAGVTPRKFRAS